MNSWYRWAISQKGNLFCWTWFLQTRKLVRTEVPEHFSLKISREDTQDPKPKEQSKIQEHNFRLNQNRFCSLQAPAWMNPMADDPGRQRVQESWIILKDHLLLAQDLASLMNKKKSCKGSQRPAWMCKELLKNLRHTRERYLNGGNRRVQGKHEDYWACSGGVRKAKAHVPFNLVARVESNKDWLSSSNSKRNPFGPATEWGRKDGDKRYKKAEVLSLPWPLLAILTL